MEIQDRKENGQVYIGVPDQDGEHVEEKQCSYDNTYQFYVKSY